MMPASPHQPPYPAHTPREGPPRGHPSAPPDGWPDPPHTDLLLVGGTFDPPHPAHLALPLAARDALATAATTPAPYLLYVPAARSPHKPTGPLATGDQRTRMLRALLAATPRAAVWTVELDRVATPAHPSYWLDTLREARRRLPPEAALRFTLGDDQALAFHRWHQPHELLRLARPVVLLRDLSSPDQLVARLAALTTPDGQPAWSPAELDLWRASVIPNTPRLPHASTTLRQRLADPASREAALAELPPSVAAIIRHERLYVTSPERTHSP